MNATALTYRQLQAELRAMQARGYAVPKLNSKRAVLEAALTELIGQQPALPASAPVPQELVTLETAMLATDAAIAEALCALPKKVLIEQAKALGIKGISKFGKTDLAIAIATHQP